MQSNNPLPLLLLSLLLLPSVVYAADQPKTILGIYMIGSDLEYNPNLTDADNDAIKLWTTNEIK